MWGTRTSAGSSIMGEGDTLKRLRCWKQASAHGHADAQYRIGLLYARGEGVVRSMSDAVAWYKRAAEAGHADARYQLGLIYLRGSVGQSRDRQSGIVDSIGVAA